MRVAQEIISRAYKDRASNARAKGSAKNHASDFLFASVGSILGIPRVDLKELKLVLSRAQLITAAKAAKHEQS